MRYRKRRPLKVIKCLESTFAHETSFKSGYETIAYGFLGLVTKRIPTSERTTRLLITGGTDIRYPRHSVTTTPRLREN